MVQLHRDNSIRVHVLIASSWKENNSSQRRAALLPMARANMRPQRRSLSRSTPSKNSSSKGICPESLAGMNVPLRFIVVTAVAWKPMHADGGLKFFKRLSRLGHMRPPEQLALLESVRRLSGDRHNS